MAQVKNRAFDHRHYTDWRDPKTLIPYEKNAKIHDEKQIKNLVTSLKRFGWQQDCVVTSDNVLVIGHGRRMAAMRIGCEIPVHVIDKKAEDLTDEDIRELRIADNQTNAETGFDFQLLAEDLEGLDFDGFDFDFQLPEIPEDPIIVNEDDWDKPLPEEPVSRPGQIYQLGRHRLMCGDSKSADDAKRLMNERTADLVFTDPPYNIASDSKNFAADCSKAMENLRNADWDKEFDIKNVFPVLFDCLSADVSVYICTSHFLAPDIWEWMKGWAEHYSYCVWAKPNPMPSLSKRHWTWNTELICYATRGKHTFNFPTEGHALSTWTINKKNGTTGHPTEKPIAVPAMAITHSSKPGDIVLDMFGGSGSTLIACEQTGRNCYTMELDPRYVDAIIDRWETFTGKKAVLLNDA